VYAILGIIAFWGPRGRSRLPFATSLVGYVLVVLFPGLIFLTVFSLPFGNDGIEDVVNSLKLYLLAAGTLLVIATGVAEWTVSRLREGSPSTRDALGDVFR